MEKLLEKCFFIIMASAKNLVAQFGKQFVKYPDERGNVPPIAPLMLLKGVLRFCVLLSMLTISDAVSAYRVSWVTCVNL